MPHFCLSIEVKCCCFLWLCLRLWLIYNCAFAKCKWHFARTSGSSNKQWQRKQMATVSTKFNCIQSKFLLIKETLPKVIWKLCFIYLLSGIKSIRFFIWLSSAIVSIFIITALLIDRSSLIFFFLLFWSFQLFQRFCHFRLSKFQLLDEP